MLQPALRSQDSRIETTRVRETVLDNGLKVLVQEVHTAPLASVWCWYRVGSRDETADGQPARPGRQRTSGEGPDTCTPSCWRPP